MLENENAEQQQQQEEILNPCRYPISLSAVTADSIVFLSFSILWYF